MNESSNGQIVQLLFIGIYSFILVNILVSVCLFFFSKIKNIKTVCLYWSSLLATYIFQGYFLQGKLSIALAFGVTFVPVCIMAKILFDSIRAEFPFKRHFGIFAVGFSTSLFMGFFDVPFTWMALPLCLSIIVPLIEPAYRVLGPLRRSTTTLQKFMALQYFLSAFHVLNFAFFRMEPGSELPGFGTALILYQVMSITLFAFAFEEFSKDEKKRLQNLVSERTKELTESYETLQNTLRIKDTLFKVVIHDIANPMQSHMMVIERLEMTPTQLPTFLPKLKKHNTTVLNIINQVRESELLSNGKLNLKLTPVNLDQCLKDVMMVFEEHMLKKNIAFDFENELSLNTTIAADPTAFTNSVMSNLISNAIKFSKPDSILKVRAFERDEKVVIEVEDFGVGMPQELTFDLFNPLKKTTRLGTNGEPGSGYGLPLVKSYVDHFGGYIKVESRSIDLFPMDHGTKFTLTLDKSTSLH